MKIGDFDVGRVSLTPWQLAQKHQHTAKVQEKKGGVLDKLTEGAKVVGSAALLLCPLFWPSVIFSGCSHETTIPVGDDDTECIDNDGDGFCVKDDCDDTNPSVYPGAEEISGNGIDEDCGGPDNSIYFIDVGQGDAVLFESNAGQYVLIDSGPSDPDDALINFLDRLGVESLHRIILSHPDYDHYGEFEDVIEHFMDDHGYCRIDGFMYTDYPNDNVTYRDLLYAVERADIPVEKVFDGSHLDLDNLSFDFYHPPAWGFIHTSSDNNDNSLVAIVCNKSNVCLYTGGDLMEEGIEYLLDRHGSDINIELFKVNHHGGSGGTTQALLDATTPEYAFICVGRNNPYGHPSPATLNLLDDNGITYYRTDEDGTITVEVVEGDAEISTER